MIGDQDSAGTAGKHFLLLIGIDQYRQGLPSLNNAGRDTRKVGELLQSRFQFEEETTISLYDENATGQKILHAFTYLREKVTTDDSLVIYFAGHGWYDAATEVGYWLPSDAKKGEVSSFLSFSILRDYLKAIKSFHTVILADACFAGTLFMERDIMAREIAFERLAQYPSRYLLAAGRNEPVSDGPVGSHSPFAGSLISILSHQTTPYLPVTELTLLLIEAVGANARQLPRGEPIRDVGHRGGVFLFRLKGYAPPQVDELPEQEAPMRAIVPESGSPTAFESLQALKKALFKNLSAGDMPGAFALFDQFLSMDSYYFNDILLLQARFNDLSAETRRGIVLREHETVERNRIYYAALEYVKLLEERDVELG